MILLVRDKLQFSCTFWSCNYLNLQELVFFFNMKINKKKYLIFFREKMHEINSKPIVSQPLPESHKCPNCVREFTTEHALLKHLEDHQNDKFKSPTKKPATPIKNNRPPAKVPFVYKFINLFTFFFSRIFFHEFFSQIFFLG